MIYQLFLLFENLAKQAMRTYMPLTFALTLRSQDNILVRCSAIHLHYCRTLLNFSVI